MALRSTKLLPSGTAAPSKPNWPPRLVVKDVDLKGTSMMPPDEDTEPTRGVLGDTSEGVIALPPLKT